MMIFQVQPPSHIITFKRWTTLQTQQKRMVDINRMLKWRYISTELKLKKHWLRARLSRLPCQIAIWWRYWCRGTDFHPTQITYMRLHRNHSPHPMRVSESITCLLYRCHIDTTLLSQQNFLQKLWMSLRAILSLRKQYDQTEVIPSKPKYSYQYSLQRASRSFSSRAAPLYAASPYVATQNSLNSPGSDRPLTWLPITIFLKVVFCLQKEPEFERATNYWLSINIQSEGRILAGWESDYLSFQNTEILNITEKLTERYGTDYLTFYEINL